VAEKYGWGWRSQHLRGSYGVSPGPTGWYASVAEMHHDLQALWTPAYHLHPIRDLCLFGSRFATDECFRKNAYLDAPYLPQ